MAQPSQVRTYYPAESAVFLKTNERFGGLSNMAPGFPIVLNGVRIRTSEALYQAAVSRAGRTSSARSSTIRAP